MASGCVYVCVCVGALGSRVLCQHRLCVQHVVSLNGTCRTCRIFRLVFVACFACSCRHMLRGGAAMECCLRSNACC